MSRPCQIERGSGAATHNSLQNHRFFQAKAVLQVPLGEEFGWGASKNNCKKVFDTFTEAGGNFIDTANHYTRGTSEKMLGEFMGSNRDYYVLATKYTLSNNIKDPNAGGNQRKNMMQSLHASLKRLNTDYVDIYWLHAWDSCTPIEEIMRAFDDMVRPEKCFI